MEIKAGMKVCNNIPSTKQRANVPSMGTIGGLVKDANGVVYAITCYHCVHNDSLDWTDFKKDLLTCRVVSELFGEQFEFGTIEFAVRNSLADIAIILIDDQITKNFAIPDKRLLKPMVTLSGGNARNITLNNYGAVSNGRLGTFEGYSEHITCPSSEQGDTAQEFDILIKVSGINDFFSVPGDSGAFILTPDDQFVGMVVMGDGNISYGIPAISIKKCIPKELKLII